MVRLNTITILEGVEVDLKVAIDRDKCISVTMRPDANGKHVDAAEL